VPQENLVNFFKYYADEPQQAEAVQLLQSAMPDSLLRSDSAWIVKYREQPPAPETTNPLPVEYDCQLDHGSEGWRLCFTASCAMTAKYWLPNLNINDYYARRPKYGDSTDASAQIRCLESFGLKARFVQVGSAEKLKAQIDRGRPAPVGYLHHGTPQNPSGGGHYSVCIGYNDKGFIFNDPYGELNLLTGSYPNPGPYGKGVVYSYQNWVPRWSVSNDHDGWGLDIWKP
tara:strand:- start:1991 stop:2677 length:687 start_codon:yes stop_codon:yes gene_type:complete